MYVDPIVSLFRQNGGRMWKGSDDRLQLMVELKSATEPELSEVIALLSGYPDVFCSENGVKVVITGNTPDPADFASYPHWVSFDGELGEDLVIRYTPDQLDRVALFSTNFRRFAKKWNGKGNFIQKDIVPFPGDDPREFWQRAEDRTQNTARLYNELGMAEYQAIEVFLRLC